MRIGARLEEPVILHGNFEPEKGKTLAYHGYLISDVASLYQAPTPELGAFIDQHWWHRDHSLRTEYMPFDLGTTEEARTAVRQFVFPRQLIDQAQRLSSRLVWCLSEDARPRVQRRQAQGRFDPMASGRLLGAIRGGTYSPETVRPFTQIARDNPQRPHVGIMAAGDWNAMWGDKEYVQRVAMLSMAISWACEALGCLCTATIGRRIRPGHNENAEALGLLWLSRPGVVIPLQAYSAVMHREMYRTGMSIVTATAHEQHIRIQRPGADLGNYLRPRGIGMFGNPLSEAADGEFHGVAWLKQQGASMTISIGEFDDAKTADVHLGSGTKLEDAIDQIAKRFEQQKRAA